MQMIDVAGHVLRVIDTGGAGSEPPIFLAADAPVVIEHLVPLADVLARERRVVALEMPGFGFSRPASTYRFTLDEQVGCLLALFDALAIERAHLAFTCVNAVLAVALAHRAPERIARLTLGQVPSLDEYRRWAARIDLKVLGVPMMATPGIGQAIMAARPGWIARRWFEGVSGPGADAAAMTRVADRVYTDGGTFCLAALNQALGNLTAADVGRAEVPTTFLWGTADRSHRRTRRESCLELAPLADVHDLDGLGHCFDVEDPARVAPLLLAP